MCTEIDKLYSELGDLHYKLCMEHNKRASVLMDQECRGEDRDGEVEFIRIKLNEATGCINEALAALRKIKE